MVEALFPPDLARIIYEYTWFQGEVISTYSYTPNLTLTYTEYTLILHGKGVDALGRGNVPYTIIHAMYEHACFIGRFLVLAESGNLFIMEYAVAEPLKSPSTSRVVGLISTHDRHLVVARTNGEVEIWNLHSKRMVRQVNFYQPTELAFTIDDRIGFVFGTTVVIWDYNLAMRIPHNPLISDDVTRIKMKSAVTALICSRGTLIVGLYNGDVCKITDGEITTTFSGHTNTVTALCALEDGFIASGSMDQSVRIWKQDTTCHRVLPYSVRTLAPLPHNQLAIGTTNHKLHILV